MIEKDTPLNNDDADVEDYRNAIQMQSLLHRNEKTEAEQYWPISTEKNDAEIAKAMQDMEMQLHESDNEKRVIEDVSSESLVVYLQAQYTFFEN